MATGSGRPGMSPLWTKSWVPEADTEGDDSWDGMEAIVPSSYPRTRGLSLDLILLFTVCVCAHLRGVMRWGGVVFHTLLTLK
ncbi:hypothetical protein F2P81_001546 [Scophthalmus maximus]|uniref:Uncharacterized protein n=1 Tax=Scophthalmus maximus TaxID=52904 RepID=A0A6A4TEI8_SCOMX|nr:hypothetical protein F2P81_001546 [Scophthalmus maximus]